MNQCLLVLTVMCSLIACSPNTENADWFLGEWISDARATRSAGSPLPPSASVGYLYWSVQGNTIYATDQSLDAEADLQFETQAITASGFRLLTTDGNFLILKTETGFCAEPFGMQSSQITIECFIPASN